MVRILSHRPGSFLSVLPDGCGFHYGFIPGDYRQINVRMEHPGEYVAYVGGERITPWTFVSVKDAERYAISWMRDHPDQDDDQPRQA